MQTSSFIHSRALLSCLLVATGLLIVGCDSGGSSPGSAEEDADTQVQKATVEVDDGSSSKARGAKAGSGVVTATFFYETEREDPCPAAASQPITPPDTTVLTPKEPDCKSGPQKGTTVSYVTLSESDGESGGIDITVKDEDDNVVTSASGDGAEVSATDGTVPNDSGVEAGSEAPPWTGTWERSIAQRREVVKITEQGFSIFFQGPNGSCDNEFMPIVESTDSQITLGAPDNGGEIAANRDSVQFQFDASISNGGSTLKLDADFKTITLNKLSSDKDPTEVVNCGIEDTDFSDPGGAPRLEDIDVEFGEGDRPAVENTVDVTVSASDPDGEDSALDYSGSSLDAPPNSSASLSVNGGQMRFTPDVEGEYFVEVKVSDGTDTISEIFPIEVFGDATRIDQENAPRIEDVNLTFGDGEEPAVGKQATLDISASDPNGDPISYSWTLLDTPSSSTTQLSATSGQQVSFTPDVAGEYFIGFAVSDGENTIKEQFPIRID